MTVQSRRPKWIAIGEILTSQGNKGEVRVKPLTDFPNRFDEMEQGRVRLPDGQVLTLPIESVRHHKESVIIKFSGIEDIDAALRLKGGVLEIAPEELVALPPGHYFVFDLIGIKVVDENGLELGELVDVLSYSANDVYVIRMPDTKEFLVPATKEVVRSIDLSVGIMVVRLLPGLLE